VSQRSEVRLEKLFDHEIPVDDLIATFEALGRGDLSPVKVLIHYP
jgi:hypothetical protein